MDDSAVSLRAAVAKALFCIGTDFLAINVVHRPMATAADYECGIVCPLVDDAELVDPADAMADRRASAAGLDNSGS